MKIIFRPERDEVTGGCRKLNNKEFLHSSAVTLRIIKFRRVRLAGHVQ
jgi:hypothetical protein